MIRNLIKQEVLKNYKKEFYQWLGVILLLGISLFLVIKEYKKLTINLKNRMAVEQSYHKLSQENIKLKEVLRGINLNATQTIISMPFDGIYDLRDLTKVILNFKTFSQSDKNFLVIRELRLERGNDTSNFKINGEIVIFQDKGGAKQ
jgi:hypothetical protein